MPTDGDRPRQPRRHRRRPELHPQRRYVAGLTSRSTAGHIYWIEAQRKRRSPAPSSTARTSISSFITAQRARLAFNVAVDAKHIYWTNFTYPNGWIGRANLDGTDVDRTASSPAAASSGIAVDTLPDTKLAGKATAARTQDQRGEGIAVRVKLKAKEQLTAKATGKIKVNPTYKLKPKKVQVAAGKTKTLRLKPKKRAARKIARALKRGEKAKAKLTVKLTDRAGNTETEKLRVRLKR